MARFAVFDVGNVLLDWNPRNLYRKLFESEAEMERFLEEVFNLDLILRADGAASMKPVLQEAADQHPHYAEQILSYLPRFSETIPSAIEGSFELLEQLLDQGPVYAITNFSSEPWAMERERFPLLKGFTDVVVSAHEGIVKPNPRIYEVLLERNDLAPQDCLFIDDRIENVEAARKIGMKGHHFTTATILKDDLVDRGLL